MQNFYNPMYYQPTAYQPQYQNQYQPQYQPQMQSVVGRMVDDFGMITANDVPMDGNPATFIKRDGSEIQTRMWSANGQIVTTTYKPFLEPLEDKTANSSSEELNALYEDFKSFKEEIFSRFDRLDKSVSAKPNSGRGNKREVESDE